MGQSLCSFRSPRALAAGAAAVDKAEAVGFKSDRERAYLWLSKNFIQVLPVSASKRAPSRMRMRWDIWPLSYADDSEARIFYALAIDQDIDPTDKTYAQRLKAGAILEKEFAKQPDHPGVAHYIIHTFDVPALASRALIDRSPVREDCTSRAARTTLPSHTFTRLGLMAGIDQYKH